MSDFTRDQFGGEEPTATVIICTRNRAESLRRTLDSIVEASVTAAELTDLVWELLIVDNGSTDATQSVVRGFSDRLSIRSVVEPLPGLSNARNAGIAAARGKYIIWTDDDVLVDERWLFSYLQAFRDYPEMHLFGGKAVPKYLQPATGWFVESENQIKSLLAIRDNPDWFFLERGRLPFGLNYAVRRDVQLQHRYNPDLGVAPGRRTGGEETSMLLAALADGAKGKWIWDAKVYHLIPTERQSLQYIFDYYRAQGNLYPKCDPRETGSAARRIAIANSILQICFKRFSTFVRKALGRKSWVGTYTEYARWVGTADHLRAMDAEHA